MFRKAGKSFTSETRIRPIELAAIFSMIGLLTLVGKSKTGCAVRVFQHQCRSGSDPWSDLHQQTVFQGPVEDLYADDSLSSVT